VIPVLLKDRSGQSEPHTDTSDALVEL